MKIDGYVFHENEQPSLISEQIECSSVDEYIDTIITLIQDAQEPDDHTAEDMLIEKLQNRDFETELDSDGEEDYIHIIVRA